MSEWAPSGSSLCQREPKAQLIDMFDLLEVCSTIQTSNTTCLSTPRRSFRSLPIRSARRRQPISRNRTTRYATWRSWASDSESFADLYPILFEEILVLCQGHGKNDIAHTARPMIQQLVNEYIPIT